MDMAIKTAQSTMDLIARDPAMRRAYEQYEKADLDFRSSIGDARREGERRGERRGERKKAQEVAKRARAKGISLESIADITGLSEQEILKL
jgi:predicted transposase/invertase (TIGR01784 family)